MSLAADHTRQQILRAAAQVFSEHPESGQIADVATAAGLGRATIYRYFASRDELIVALVEEAHTELGAAIVGAHLEDTPAAPAFKRLVRIIVAHMHTHGYLLFERAAGPSNPGAAASAKAAFESSDAARIMRDLFQRSQDEGVLRTDLDIDWIAHALFGMAITAVRTQITDHHELDHAAWLVSTLFLQGATPQADHTERPEP